MSVSSLSNQLKKIDLKNAKMSNHKTVGEIMVREAKRLYKCIQAQIDLYYASYKPKYYQRTGRLQRALYAEELVDIRIVKDTLHIGVGFKRELAMHPNLEGVYWSDGYGNDTWFPIHGRHHSYVPVLMEFGWHSRNLAAMLGQEVYYLTYYEGSGMIQRGIDNFNATNPFGIHVVGDGILNVDAY